MTAWLIWRLALARRPSSKWRIRPGVAHVTPRRLRHRLSLAPSSCEPWKVDYIVLLKGLLGFKTGALTMTTFFHGLVRASCCGGNGWRLNVWFQVCFYCSGFMFLYLPVSWSHIPTGGSVANKACANPVVQHRDHVAVILRHTVPLVVFGFTQPFRRNPHLEFQSIRN